jgi:MFS family permease
VRKASGTLGSRSNNSWFQHGLHRQHGRLQASLHATIVDVQWVVESYGLVLAALILVGGSLGDLFGQRRMFLVGVEIFAAASIACGLSLNIQQLVIARCVQGVGAAFVVPGSLSIISA